MTAGVPYCVAIAVNAVGDVIHLTATVPFNCVKSRRIDTPPPHLDTWLPSWMPDR